MPIRYNPNAPEMYNQVRGMPMAGGRPNGYGAPRRTIPGPTSVMPMGGPRIGEVNAGAPMQGNPLMGQFPSMPSRYGNSMGQAVARPTPPPTQPGPGMPVPPRPTPPPSKYPPTGPQRSGTEMRAPQPYQQPAPAAEHSPRFMQMLQNTANMNDVERANYINSQRDSLMERLARYDFAKNRGLVLDESAQADYDNIAAMMQEINRYNEKIADMQRRIDAGEWRVRPEWSGTIGGLPIMPGGRASALEALNAWNSPRNKEERLRLQEEQLQRMLDELAQYRTGGYGL